MPTTVNLEFAPRLMPTPVAARYLGISPSMLRTLPIPRKKLGAKRLYDRIDLDAYADRLSGDDEVNTCDEVFGCG